MRCKGIQVNHPRQMKEALLAEVRDWIGQAQQFDDITLLVIGRQKVL